MKFLSISKPKDTLTTLPPPVIRQILEVSMAAMKQQKEEGKILDYYSSPEGCAVVILDYESAEEWLKDQNKVPILTYYNHEVYPLADMEETINTFIEALKAVEATMPGSP